MQGRPRRAVPRGRLRRVAEGGPSVRLWFESLSMMLETRVLSRAAECLECHGRHQSLPSSQAPNRNCLPPCQVFRQSSLAAFGIWNLISLTHMAMTKFALCSAGVHHHPRRMTWMMSTHTEDMQHQTCSTVPQQTCSKDKDRFRLRQSRSHPYQKRSRHCSILLKSRLSNSTRGSMHNSSYRSHRLVARRLQHHPLFARDISSSALQQARRPRRKVFKDSQKIQSTMDHVLLKSATRWDLRRTRCQSS